MKKIMMFFGLIVLMSSLVSAALTDNLVSYWSMDNSGDMFKDDYGSNDGTAVGSPSYVTGAVGPGAADFTPNQRVDIPQDSSLDITGPISIQAWINPDSLGEDGLVSKINAGGVGAYGLWLRASGNVQILVDTGASVANSAGAAGAVTTGVWNHVVGVYNGTYLITYVNGAEWGKFAWSGTIDTTAAGPTLASMFTTNHYDGGIDEAAIWNRALSPAEVSELYNGGSGIAPTSGTQGGEDVIPEFSSIGMILAVMIAIVGVAVVRKKYK